MTAPDGGGASADLPLQALVSLLAEEREGLRSLIFRMTVASLLVAQGNDRYVARAGDDVTDAAGRIGELELARAVAAMELAGAWGLDSDQPTLRDIIDAAPPHYRSVLDRHLTELSELSAWAAELAAVGKEVAGAAASRVSEAIGRLEA